MIAATWMLEACYVGYVAMRFFADAPDAFFAPAGGVPNWHDCNWRVVLQEQCKYGCGTWSVSQHWGQPQSGDSCWAELLLSCCQPCEWHRYAGGGLPVECHP
jgi:hypothetical protein